MAKLNCIHILFSFIQKSFLKQSIANSIFQFIDDWIRIGVLLCWKRLLYQQSHNLCQSTATAHTHYLLFQYQLNSSQRAISKQFNRILFGPSLYQNNKSISQYLAQNIRNKLKTFSLFTIKVLHSSHLRRSPFKLFYFFVNF